MMKSFEDRYKDEILSDNSAFDYYAQCKNCMFQSEVGHRRGSCLMFPYPEIKPPGVMHNTDECEYFEKQ